MGVFLFGAVVGLVCGKLSGLIEPTAVPKAPHSLPPNRLHYVLGFIGATFAWCLLPVFASINETD